jgi:hypothetical protein
MRDLLKNFWRQKTSILKKVVPLPKIYQNIDISNKMMFYRKNKVIVRGMLNISNIICCDIRNRYGILL